MAKQLKNKLENKYNNLSAKEQTNKESILDLFDNCPLSNMEKLNNLGMFLGRMQLQRILTLSDIYQRILPYHGIIVEFGTRWGYNLALLAQLRGIFEPYVRSRKLVGFDTFEGFISPGAKDGRKSLTGDFGVTKGYDQYLARLLKTLEQQSPIAHICKFELVKGDAVKEINRYLKRNQQTLIAMAYFDMNLYQPTKECLKAIKPFLSKGSIIVFDQLNYEDHPGETIAFREVFGTSLSVNRTPTSSSIAYVTIE
jgi:hypothetical protein